MKVAIQGLESSYHDIARKSYFSGKHQVVHCDTFKEVFESVEHRRADFGLVAIENSLYGSINEVYDLLLKYKFWISGEIYLRINHCLLANKNAQITDIKQVHSQLPALAQCEDFLDTHLSQAERVEEHDTSASAALVAKANNIHLAAIASESAAKLYDLQILASDIESNKQNYTRFIIFSKNKTLIKDADKTSLIVHTDNDTQAGALYRTLGVFANRNINLTKIESRPIVGKAWHYLFYLDFEIGANSAEGKEALKELEAIGAQATVLGSYKKGIIKT
ncbi:MAG TPA: prephenate dehydratase [Candidatus Saccharibacteria bacterium]|nr:prephenate dehydratase [Candidatus Saccharibacteria bacterium]HMT39719.1 prephenate dehydratase [Candidatus Saccharibacteria bacterium]